MQLVTYILSKVLLSLAQVALCHSQLSEVVVEVALDEWVHASRRFEHGPLSLRQVLVGLVNATKTYRVSPWN